MKRITRFFGLVCVCATTLLSSACWQCESEEIRVTLNEDLSGNVTFLFKNVSSDEKHAAAQEAEIRDFCGDQSKLPEALKEAGLKDTTIEISNQTPFKCDAVLKGSFDNILSLLPLLAEVEKGDFQVTKIDNLFSLRVRAKGLIADTPDLLSLKYTGEIFDHNAQSPDSEAPALQWRPKDSGNQSIYFSARTRSNN